MEMIPQSRIAASFCALMVLVIVTVVDVPNGLAFLPGVLGVVLFGLWRFAGVTKPRFSKNVFLLALITFGLSALSLTWALHFDDSLKQVWQLAFLLPPQVFLISLVSSFTRDDLKSYAHFLSYGVAFTSVLLCFEMLSDGVLFNFIRGLPLNVPADPDEFNRPSCLLVMYGFSAMAILKAHTKNPLPFLAIIAPLVAVVMMTESQSAQMAFATGLIFMFLFPYRSALAWRGLVGFVLILMLTVPFLVTYVYNNFATNIQDFPGMAHAFAGHRLEIWDYVSRYALQEPLHGYGIEMTRSTIFDSRHIFEKGSTILHPHNFVVQIWVEFGLIGILVAMWLMYSLFSMIRGKFTTEQQKIILPTLMATMVPASFAFGLWQGWWIGAFFHVASMCLIACKVTGEGGGEGLR